MELIIVGLLIGLLASIVGSKLESSNALRNYRREQLTKLALSLDERKSNRENIHKHWIEFIERKGESDNGDEEITRQSEDMREQDRLILTLILLHAWEIMEYAKRYHQNHVTYYDKIIQIAKDANHDGNEKDQLDELERQVSLSENLLMREISKLIYKRSRLEKLIDW